jgi:hypothetical protein
MIAELITVLSLAPLSEFAYYLGRLKPKVVKFSYPECAHVWNKWQRVTKPDMDTVWGQRRTCDVCGLTEWKRWSS